ncbi:atherin [Drosophila bipectinata]|uniref:atherin n=1 Tax=Drosophila bipectinata TaxID=42026 RepID=UPI001C8AC98C|nr:oleosin-B6 [Drosophila bipectinata]KAH8246116.1 hypothetical protein KR026_010341 [Drosophila bipectinata]
MANPKSSGGNKAAKSGKNHGRQTQQNPPANSQVAATNVAMADAAPPTPQPLVASHPSEDTLALAAAVAASIPAAPLARPPPERRASAATVVPMSQSESGPGNESLASQAAAGNPAAPAEARRSIFQRLFGSWSS